METIARRKKWFVTIGRSLLFCISCAAILAATSGMLKDDGVFSSMVWPVALAAAGAFILTLLFTRWGGLHLKDVGIVPGLRTVPRFLGGFAIGLVMAGLQLVFIWSSGHVSIVRSPVLPVNEMSANLLLYLVIACREEMAFRGYPLRAIDYAIGPWAAQGIVAGIFIIEHVIGGMTWMQAVIGPGTGAILFGLAALRTKGLALPIGLHAAWNAGQWALGFKNNSGLYHAVIEPGFEKKVSLMAWIGYLSIMWTVILILYFRKLRAEAKE